MGESEIVVAAGVATDLGLPKGLVESARGYSADARAESTRRAYRTDWTTFTTWCETNGLQALPATPETVGIYLAARADAGRKTAKIARELAAISEAHRAAGHASPRTSGPVRAVWGGIRRRLGVAQRQVAPLRPADLRTMIAKLPPGILGLRDRALLVIGFSGAFRRSELVALDVDAIVEVEDGLEITLRRSKTDQLGAGRKVGLPFSAQLETCPVRTLRAWLVASAIVDGPVFRPVGRGGRVGQGRLSDRAVARLIKRAAPSAGVDPTTVSGHSLRAGFATSAARAGKSERSIMRQTGHASAEMVRRYVRGGTLFEENAAAGLL